MYVLVRILNTYHQFFQILCICCGLLMYLSTTENVHSVEQKSIGLIFRTSRSGSHMTYSCHHNSSRFTFPIFVHSWLKTDLAVTIHSLTLSWLEAETFYKTNTVIKVNPIENMRGEVKRTMQETWPVLPPRNGDELWALVSDAWDEVASSRCYIRSLIESATWRMKSVVEAEGFGTSY